MKLFENIKKIGQIFKIIDWVNSHKRTFNEVAERVEYLRGDVYKLKADVCELKTTLTGNKESDN
jgi:hypothetical protein